MFTPSDALQKAVGYILTIVLAAFLALAWILTAPLLHLSVYLGDFYRKRFGSAVLDSKFGARMPR